MSYSTGSEGASEGPLCPKCVAWVTTYVEVCSLFRGLASTPFAVEIRVQHGKVLPIWHPLSSMAPYPRELLGSTGTWIRSIFSIKSAGINPVI